MGRVRVGATLLVGPKAWPKPPTNCRACWTAQRVTVWCPVPSLLAVIAAAVAVAADYQCRGRSRVPQELVRRWARRPAHDQYLWSHRDLRHRDLGRAVPGRPVTIGKALPGFALWVVDAALIPVAPGEEGELLIGGPGVGAGYRNDQELTKRNSSRRLRAGERVYRTGDLVRRECRRRSGISWAVSICR